MIPQRIKSLLTILQSTIKPCVKERFGRRGVPFEVSSRNKNLLNSGFVTG